MTRPFMFVLTLLMMAALVTPAAAQAPADPAPENSAAAAADAQDDDPDRDPNDSQPDFYVATLNTNLRLPKGAFNFRLTHRFTTPLGEGLPGAVPPSLRAPDAQRGCRPSATPCRPTAAP